MLWLLAQGKSSREVAEVTGYSLNWIHILVWRYNQQGPQAIMDHRHRNPAQPPSCQLSSKPNSCTPSMPLHRIADCGGKVRSGRQVAQWIQTRTGRKVHPQRGWEYLKRLNYSKRVLRPRHAKADPTAQEAFKKPFPNR